MKLLLIAILVLAAGCSPIPSRFGVGVAVDPDSRKVTTATFNLYYDTPPALLGK